MISLNPGQTLSNGRKFNKKNLALGSAVLGADCGRFACVASAMPIEMPMNPMMDMMVNGALPIPMATQEITP